MLEWIQHIDTRLFFHVNHCLRNEFFDVLMPIARNKLTWIPLYLVIIFLIVRRHKTKAVYVLGFALLTLVLADQISAHIIKPLVERPRPCNDIGIGKYVHTLVNCGSGYSFVSSHATNHFALAFYFITVFARPSNRFYVVLGFVFWAGLISFAQVYVGVHY
ncbi:MAG: phosphatase PAP2 family protein, partial [Bacteroidia bacterium]|nr:phosphatase PAP2 family protein [Bacteroidia bacterium]